MKTALEFTGYVECSKCGSKFDEDEVEVTNCESDIFERDTVTFECPRCGAKVTSLRYR